MIYSVSNDLTGAQKIEQTSFSSLAIWERRHIQEWVRTNPELLGEDLLVLSIEFDRFVNSSDRLDLLALDRAGNLVVIELKRDSAAGLADLQAIRYAAMVSSMTVEKVVPYYAVYRRKYYGEEISHTEAREQIHEFVERDDFVELSKQPRIILCSEDFSQEITTTVLWLRQSGIDVSCVRITPYKVNGQLIVVPNLIIPLKEAKQYLIDIRVKEEEQVQAARRTRPKSMRVLVENGLVQPGERIFLKNALPSHVTFVEGDTRFVATITGKLGQSDAVLWQNDGAEYAISALTWKIFRDLHPEQKPPGGINGNWHWVNVRGETLWSLAQAHVDGAGAQG